MRIDGTQYAPTMVLACTLAGCLPAGESPAGRHLVHDRTLSGVFLSPSEQAGVPSYVLASGPVFHPELAPPRAYDVLADLYLFFDASSAMPVDGLANTAPILDNIYFPHREPTDFTFATDAKGRLFYLRRHPTEPEVEGNPYALCRRDLDWPTDDRCFTFPSITFTADDNSNPRLRNQPFLLSPGRTQLFTGNSGFAWVIGLREEHRLALVLDGVFIGEDFYCTGIETAAELLSPLGSRVIRLKPDSPPERLLWSTGQIWIAGVVNAVVPQLVLSVANDRGWVPYSMLDTATLETRVFPREQGEVELVSSSPNGQFLLFRAATTVGTETQPTEYHFFVLDWTTDRFVELGSTWVGKGLDGVAEWRPGTSDLWLGTLPAGVAIWSPNRPAQTLATQPYRHRSGTGETSMFTADGRHWFAQGAEPLLRLYVGSAAAPDAPLFPLHPEGTNNVRYWLLEDGRLLVEAWPSHQDRNDIYLVDADAHTSRELGSAGRVVAVGRERVLTLLNWIVSRSSGELTLVDYASGAHTLLAADVYAVDVDRGPSANVAAGTDALAPGTRVALLSRNRLPSRDDGLWLLELP